MEKQQSEINVHIPYLTNIARILDTPNFNYFVLSKNLNTGKWLFGKGVYVCLFCFGPYLVLLRTYSWL